MTKPLFVGRPNIGNLEVFNHHLKEILNRRWLTNNGKVVQELEQNLRDHLGVRHCIPVCNGTIGLQIVCRALDLSGEVIMPAFTFAATPHSVRWQGLSPVFVDINPKTHLLNSDYNEAAITPRTSAILGVHTWGRACYPELLQEIALRHNLKLYFDAAHAFGAGHNGKMIGNFGNCEVFSFHATKFFNTFEGGAIATNDDDLAAKVRLMINFGFQTVDTVVELGTNAKMSEIHAAMGLACKKSLNQILKTNKSFYDLYRTSLSNLPGITFHDYDDVELTNFQYVVIEIDKTYAGLDRDKLMHLLHEQEIMVRRYFYPGCHRIKPYSIENCLPENSLLETERLCERIMILPTGTGIELDDVKRVISGIKKALASNV